MPPKAMKTIAYRRKLPIRQSVANSSPSPLPPSPSPPAKKSLAVTTTKAQARKLQREAPSTLASKRVVVTMTSSSSSSTFSGSSDTSNGSSPMDETNVFEKFAKSVERSPNRVDEQRGHIDDNIHRSQIHGDALPEGVCIFGGAQTNKEEEEEMREQMEADNVPEQEQTNAQEQDQTHA